MNILILDDEIYLAQKVSMRLQDEGYNCHHVANIKEVHFDVHYDTILLSTNISSEDVHKIIEAYRESIIILLVSYVNDVTVTKPLKDGANDYIVKPFIMNELIRKIHHYEEFEKLKKENKTLKNSLEFSFNDVEYENAIIPSKPPFLIQTNDQRVADKIALDMAVKQNKTIKFVSLEYNPKYELENKGDSLVYLYNFHYLKKTAKDNLLEQIKDSNIIISSVEDYEQNIIQNVHISAPNKLQSSDSIMTINDYVKLMILNFQNKYPDTELSKKLGISRKSLWEKRKKFGIEKTK